MLDLAVLSRRNAGRDATRGKRGTEPITVIATVCNESFGRRETAKHQARALMITRLAFRQQQGNRPSLAVADGVQLGVQPALGAANTAGNSPF
jgi:hypothetical protein